MYPDDYRYTTEHEWVRVEDDIAVLGVTDFAQKELGEVVFVELPQVGHVYDAGDESGSFVKDTAVAEIYTPIAGEIVEVNEALADDPELVNEDPHVDGWLVKIRFSASSDLDSLMDAEAYGEFVQQGKH